MMHTAIGIRAIVEDETVHRMFGGEQLLLVNSSPVAMQCVEIIRLERLRVVRDVSQGLWKALRSVL